MSSNSVFISYRRDASKYLARAVFQDLKLSRGIDVFMDVENIDSGTFDTIILNQIAARPYFLLILTPATLNRCVEPGDWLLREIDHAMKLNRIIVPMTTPEFSFDDADKYLESSLAKELRRFSGLGIVHEYFDAGMDKLCNRFLKPVDLQVEPTPNADKATVAEKIQQAVSEPKASEDELSAQAFFEHGKKAYDEKRYDDAILDFIEAIQRSPNFADAYNGRGIVRYMRGDKDGAIADYTEAIRLNPQYDKAYNNRGLCLNLKGDYDGAIADYTEAIRINPQFATAYNGRGNTRSAKGDKDGAIADYTEAIRLNPQYDKAYNNRGLCLNLKGDYDGAIADYTEAIRIEPNYASAYNNRADARRAIGDITGAEADEAMVKRLNGGQ